MNLARYLCALTATTALLLVGACGNDSQDDGASGGSSSSTTSTSSGTPTCEGAPSEGEPCSPPGYVCSFPGSPCGGTATCVSSQWQVEVTCPPADECPQMQPSDGAPCSLSNPPAGPLECSYSCSGDPSNMSMATCNDTSWFIAPCPGGGSGGSGGGGGAGGAGGN